MAYVMIVIYWGVSLAGMFFYLRGDNYKKPSGILYFSTVYYTQNLFFGDAEAFDGLNKGAIPHYSIYFFYTVLMLVVIADFWRKQETKLQASTFRNAKLRRVAFFYRIQAAIFFIFLNYTYYIDGIDLFDKSQVSESGNKFFFLFHYSCLAIMIINIALRKWSLAAYFFPVLDLLYFLILAYRGILVEFALVALCAVYLFSINDMALLKKKFVFMAMILGYLFLAPFKYFINLLYQYILFGDWPDISMDSILVSAKSGNEGSATMGIADMVIRADIQLPDWYFIKSLVQHIPLVRQLFGMDRISFNNFFQEKIFGQYDFGVGSSSVAEVYTIAWLPGLLLFAVFIGFLIRIRPRHFYTKLLYLGVMPGYLFFIHRVDWQQIFFMALMFFYASIFPFVLSSFFIVFRSGVKYSLLKTKGATE